MNAIFETLYKSQPVTYRVNAPIEASVERLSRAAQCGSLFPMAEALVGSVTASRVVLKRQQPMIRNWFAPVFVGSFRNEPDGVALEGRFTFSRIAKILIGIWLSFVAIALLSTVGNYVFGQAPFDKRVAGFFYALLLLFFGVAIPNFGWLLSRHDIDYISRRVHESLEPVATARAKPVLGVNN